METTCRLLDEVVTRKNLKSRRNSAFRVDDKEISDPVEIANRFCLFFSNFGPNQAKRVKLHISHRFFFSGDFPRSMFKELAIEEEIRNTAN